MTEAASSTPRGSAGAARVEAPRREPVPVAPLVNPANALTVLRLVLIPVFVWLAITSQFELANWRIAACVVFCAASATDFADGWLARARNLVTPFGKVADPIADKALTGTALLLLSIYGGLPWWITGLILGREIGVTALRFWVLRHGVIAASRGGKLKTVLQVVSIAWYLWPWPAPFAGFGIWLMSAALVATVLTGFDYVARAFALRRHRPRDSG